MEGGAGALLRGGRGLVRCSSGHRIYTGGINLPAVGFISGAVPVVGWYYWTQKMGALIQVKGADSTNLVRKRNICI